MRDLLPIAEKLGAILKDRHETIAIAESSTGGLISAALLAVTEALAQVLATGTLKRFSTTWSLAEVGAAGPTGNRYGDPAGHSCIAIAGPVERAITVETGSADRVANMRAFAAAALELLVQDLASSRAARS
jgi:nicotinamide-nucleotide amidase